MGWFDKAVAVQQARISIPRGTLEPMGLTAAALRVQAPERDIIPRLRQAWQQVALSYYDAIPEIHYCGNFYARSMQNCRFFVGERDANGEIKESENEAAIELFDRVQDPGGGRRTMTARFGQLAFVTGEALMMWSAETEKDEEIWEVVSTDELRQQGDGSWVRFRAPGLGGQTVKSTPDGDWSPVPSTSIVYRLWTEHPRYSWLADSPMRGVLDLCKELLILTQAVNAMAISHAARAGLLLVPEEISFPPVEGGTDENPNVDPMTVNLTRALMAAIGDPSSAAALAPLVIRAQAEFLHPDVFRWLGLADEKDKYPEENLRTECIRRIALGLDMPPEELLGKADVNHWTSWEISEDAWRHVEPVAWAFAQNLSTAYLRPTARKENIDGWETLCIGVDESAAVVKPDRGSSANEVAKQGGLSLEALRAAHDFSDEDKPSDDEFRIWLAISLNDPQLLPDSYRPDPPPAPIVVPHPGAQPPVDGQPTDQTGKNIPKGPPQDGKNAAQPEQPNGALPASASVDRVLGAAEMAVVRSREKAGARVKGAAQGCADCRETIKGVPDDMIASVLGPQTLSDLDLRDASALVAGGADGFETQLIRWGWTPVQAAALGELVEQHAARNLFESVPAPVAAGLAGHVRRGVTGE